MVRFAQALQVSRITHELPIAMMGDDMVYLIRNNDLACLATLYTVGMRYQVGIPEASPGPAIGTLLVACLYLALLSLVGRTAP